MLVNSQNQVVTISPKFSSTTHPKLFTQFHEILEPTPKYVGKMFNIEQRARITKQQ